MKKIVTKSICVVVSLRELKEMLIERLDAPSNANVELKGIDDETLPENGSIQATLHWIQKDSRPEEAHTVNSAPGEAHTVNDDPLHKLLVFFENLAGCIEKVNIGDTYKVTNVKRIRDMKPKSKDHMHLTLERQP